MERKYQIFISSTFKDLEEERKEVTNSILKMKHIPIGMEAFNAGNLEQWKLIQETIDDSDYYILIVAGRYGSIHEEKGISYTELEYRYALEKGIPVIAFIRDKNDISVANYDSGEKLEKLNKFRDELLAKRMIAHWKNKDDLSKEVVTSLAEIFIKNPRIGWVRNKNNEDFTSKNSVRDKIGVKLYNEEKNVYEKENIKIIYSEISKEENYEELLKRAEIPAEIMKDLKPQNIKDYEEEIPTKEEVEEYNRRKFLFEHKKNKNFLKTTIEISNLYTKALKDVHLIINFPKELIVFESYDIEEIKEPKKLELPDKDRLYKIAKRNRDQTEFNRKLGIAETNLIGVSKSKPIYNDLLRKMSHSNNYLPPVEKFFTIYNDSIEIKNVIIYQNRVWRSPEIFIITPQKGKFTISYDLVGDILEAPLNGSFELVVE